MHKTISFLNTHTQIQTEIHIHGPKWSNFYMGMEATATTIE